MSDNLPKGFTCECGKFHEFHGYVYAHWRDELIHECKEPGCGRKHVICGGHAELLHENEDGKTGSVTRQGKRALKAAKGEQPARKSPARSAVPKAGRRR